MIRLFALAVVAAALFVGCASTYTTTSDQPPDEQQAVQPMSITDVINLAKEGVSDKVIVDQLHATHSTFRLSSDDIITLKKSGVSQRVISAMINLKPEVRHRYTYYPDPWFYYNAWWPYYGGYPYYYGTWGYRFHYGYAWPGYRSTMMRPFGGRR